MAASVAVSTMESTDLRPRKYTTIKTSGKLFSSLQLEAKTKAEGPGCSSARPCVDPQRGLQPARKKLTTLEAQRIMAVLTKAIRRIELASVLPQLVTQRRPDLNAGLGAELTSALEVHDVLLRSLDELKQQRPAGSFSSKQRSHSTSSQQQQSTSDKHDFMTAAADLDSDERSMSSTSTSDEALSRNVSLVEQSAGGSLRDLLRLFTLNPAACDAVLGDPSLVQLRSQSADEIIRQLNGLRESLMSRLLTTPVENVEWSRYLREMSEKEQYNCGVIVKLTGELEAAEQLKDADVTRQNDVIRRLQADIHEVERAASESLKRTRTEAEKQEAAERKNSEGKLANVEQELAQVRADYTSVLAMHRDGEQALRKRKFQVETEVENWIQKFDADMGERQDEYEEIDALYMEEKKQLNELEERFHVLETEYNRIMDERRRAREVREAAERHLQTLIRASLTIQAFWRSFKVRKAIKAKRRRCAIQKKGKKYY